MKNDINVKDLTEWIGNNRILYSTLGRKKLFVKLGAGYEIELNGTIIWEGYDISEAVQIYNEAPTFLLRNK